MMNNSVYIIAEAGVNHNGSLELAKKLVIKAAESGADAVKFQTFKASKLVSASAEKAQYQKATTSTAESQLEMLQRLELKQEWHAELVSLCAEKKIQFLSTAFDTESLVFLSSLDIPFYKIPSGELTNTPLLWQFARYRKPMVLSTGMSTLSEVELALAVITHAFVCDQEPKSTDEIWRVFADAENRSVLKDNITLLHCTSQYPTPVHEVNLKAMDTLAHAFGLPVGYSDHTQGITIPVAAVARGACLIEKHFTLDRSMPGPDHLSSLEPDELTSMVTAIRDVSVALGDGFKGPQPSEFDTKNVARQKVVATKNIAKGSVLTREDLTTQRSAEGSGASTLWDLVGKTVTQDIACGTPVSL